MKSQFAYQLERLNSKNSNKDYKELVKVKKIEIKPNKIKYRSKCNRLQNSRTRNRDK